MFQRLGTRDWFTSRTSACGILPRLFARLGQRKEGGEGKAGDESKMELEIGGGSACREDALELYRRLAADDTPLVRRAACTALADMGSALAGGVLKLPPCFSDGVSDDDPMGRKPTAAAAVAVAAAAVVAGTRDGLNVETGDITAASVPPPVPSAIAVSASSRAAGSDAALTLLPVLLAFSRDDQDSVRLVSVDACVALAWLVNGGNASTVNSSSEAAAALSTFSDTRLQVLQITTDAGKDKSWRVRWSVANRLSELADAFGPALSTERLLPLFETMLSVRKQTCVLPTNTSLRNTFSASPSPPGPGSRSAHFCSLPSR
jgi:serine/threonine-protein phosphatase 2A regulatory subunit A